MGYDVHITRADDWGESAASPISLDEWIAYVKSDPEMRFDGFAEAKSPSDQILRYENPGLAVWLAHSGSASGRTPWFDLRQGCVTVKNPDEEILAKMRAIAQALGARVQGDDGELY